MNSNIITLIYDIEEKIINQKEWIEIGNLLCENEDFTDTKLYLILDRLTKSNEEIYSEYEDLISEIQNL
jgi:hypothetical protein